MTALDNSLRIEARSAACADSWQQQLRDAIRTASELADALGLSIEDLGFSDVAATDFPLLVPRAFAARMQPGNTQDPLLRQVLPAGREMLAVEGFGHDPVGEVERAQAQPGILTKYQGRALMITTGHCAVNCRYCFRRHYPYGDDSLNSGERLRTVRELARDSSIRELILSGGDPLLLGDRQLAAICDEVAAAPAMHTLRIHSRLPIVIPDRVGDGLLQALTKPDLNTVMVLHCNHPGELDAPTCAAVGRLRDAGMTVLNQAVLLAGVNDTADTLAGLSTALFSAGALPYYLHLLDPVAGAAHFHVDETRARRLVGDIARSLPGYLVPRLAKEISGAASKRELAPIYESA